MKCHSPSLPCACVILYLTAHVMGEDLTAHACTFPDFMQLSDSEEPCTWRSGIRHNRTHRQSCYRFHHNVLDIIDYASSSGQKPVRWKCSFSFHGNFLLKRTDPQTLQNQCVCVKFLRRSQSIVQLLWSQEGNRFDPNLCEDRNLHLDPWPLVSFKLIADDFVPSPFRGGYSMRITDSQTGENGCNYMHRPMKFESDCLTGEGVLFDFISENCVPSSVAMFVKQRTLPVASWKHRGEHYVILRRGDNQELFCLRVPDTTENHLNAFLFTDLACLTEGAHRLLTVPSTLGVKYLVLHLQKLVYRHLCDDEYPQCSAVTCNSYIRHECHKACKVCDVNNPPPTCSFPRRVRGQWYQMDKNGFSQINITETDLIIDPTGHFRCAVFPDSPAKRSKMYTTVSMFKNGCRPRYTCVKFQRLGPSVLKYSLSRSIVWPGLEENYGATICSSSQFGMDPEPINDLYRTDEDTGKPIITYKSEPDRVPCNLTSSFTISATLPNGSLCHGSLYEHCQDNTRLRLYFHAGCGQVVSTGQTITSPYQGGESPSLPAPSYADYSCLAHFQEHYWERMLLLQNVRDEKDARCLLLTELDASQALMMVAGQCDKNSWNFARAGLRTPLLRLQLRVDEFPCKYIPISTTTTPNSKALARTTYDSGLATHPSPISFTLTLPQSPPGHQDRISASYVETKEKEQNSIDYRPKPSPKGNEPGSAGFSIGARLVSVILLAAFADWVNR